MARVSWNCAGAIGVLGALMLLSPSATPAGTARVPASTPAEEERDLEETERPRDPAHPEGAPTTPDGACLRFLGEKRVPFRRAPPVGGVRTPVEITGPLVGLRLVPRAGRPALMDCELARALTEAAPVLASSGIDRLSFSGAYSYRMRKGTNQLSAHAFGLAIDVHGLQGPAGSFDVTRDFEAGAGTWRGLVPQQGGIEACIGTPDTDAGRRLRTIVCRLKHHSAFRVIVTPDDNDDHRDHLHLEAFPDALTRVSRVLGVLPLRK